MHSVAKAQPPVTSLISQAAALRATNAAADPLTFQPATLPLPSSFCAQAAQQGAADHPAETAETWPAQAGAGGAGAPACIALQAPSAAASILAALQDPGFDAYVDRTEELWQAMIAQDRLSAEQHDAALVQAALAASAEHRLAASAGPGMCGVAGTG